MGYVDDILAEFDGLLSVADIRNMTYKELGYMRDHHKKHHPSEAMQVAKALMSKSPER